MATETWLATSSTIFTLDASGSTWITRLSTEPMPSSCDIEIRVQWEDAALAPLNPGAVFYCSRDGRTRWQVTIEGADIFLRKFAYGTELYAVDLGPHNMTRPEAVLTVRVTGNDLVITTNDSTAAPVEYLVTLGNGVHPENDLVDLTAWGFVSNVNLCVVSQPMLYQLTPGNATKNEILMIVCGGTLYSISDADGTAVRTIGRVADTTGRVGLADFDGLGLIVGGGLANIYDPVTETLTPWFDDEHTYLPGPPVSFATLPGALEPTATETTKGRGTTDCNIIEVHNNRVALSGSTKFPQTVFLSASGNFKSWRILNINLGEASAYTIDSQDTVTCLVSLPSNNMLVGCKNTMRMHLGDPLWGQAITPQVADSGVSGPYAAAESDLVHAVVHGPAGLWVVPQDGSLPFNITGGVLTEGIQFSVADIGNYTVSLARDPVDAFLMVYLVPIISGAAISFLYDERSGSYKRDSGGLFPEQYPPECGPTAAIYWRRKLVLGTRNGFLLQYSSDKTDDFRSNTLTNQNIESWLTMSLVAAAHPIGDTIITSWRVLLSDASDAIPFRVYGGPTAESAYNLAGARQLFHSTAEPFGPPFIEMVRSPAMFLFIYNDATAGRYWELEQVVGNFEVGTMIAPNVFVEPAAPPPPPTPTTTTGGGTPPTGTTDGPGGGSNPPGSGYGGGTKVA